jgi:hypothetical protein
MVATTASKRVMDWPWKLMMRVMRIPNAQPPEYERVSFRQRRVSYGDEFLRGVDPVKLGEVALEVPEVQTDPATPG